MTVIVFDLDGTLVDSAVAIRDIANELMQEEGLPPLDLAEAQAYIGNGAPVFLQRALKARASEEPERFPARLARYEAIYAAAPASASPPYAGVDAALRALHAQGHRLGLCTNKPAVPTRLLLDAHGWGDLFAVVVDGDALPVRKPAPEPLLHAIAGAGGGAAVYVGDSEVDAATATAAGIPFLFFTGGYSRVPLSEIRREAEFADYAALSALVACHARGGHVEAGR